jgi:hypothetical protein
VGSVERCVCFEVSGARNQSNHSLKKVMERSLRKLKKKKRRPTPMFASYNTLQFRAKIILSRNITAVTYLYNYFVVREPG